MDEDVCVCRGAETTIDVGPVANHDGGGISGDAGGGHDGVSQMDRAAATPHHQLMVILADCADAEVAGRPFVIEVIEEVEVRPQVDLAIREQTEQRARRAPKCAAQPTDVPGARQEMLPSHRGQLGQPNSLAHEEVIGWKRRPRDERGEIRATHPETKKCAGEGSGGGSEYHVRSAGIPTEIDLQCCEGGGMEGDPGQTPTTQYQAGLQCGRLESKSDEGIAFLSLVGRPRNPVVEVNNFDILIPLAVGVLGGLVTWRLLGLRDTDRT